MPIASKLCAFARIPARRAVFAAFSARRAPAQQTKKRDTRITPRQSADPAPRGKRRSQGAGKAENEHNDKERPNGLSLPVR